MINISTWSIKNPVPAIMLFMVLSITGLIAFFQLKIQNFPPIDVPTITVSASLQGASPSQLETEVTRKIEDSVASIEGIDTISSTVSQGSSSTTIAFKLSKNSLQALTEVRDAVSSIKATLPADVQDPIISKVNVSGSAILTYAVASTDRDIADLSWFIDNHVAKKMLSIDGVSKISRQGGVDREASVEVSMDKLREVGLTIGELSTKIKSSQLEASGGTADLGGTNQAIRTKSTVTSTSDLGAMPINVNGSVVSLSDIAKISDVPREKAQEALLNGSPIVVFQVFKTSEASDPSIKKDVESQLDLIVKDNPDLTVSLVSEEVSKTQLNYDSSMNALWEGALLAVIVVGLFLRDARATLISAIALPLSILPTFAAMYYFFGHSLNGITLLALTLIVGVLVDDAIVEVENIVRHMNMGKPPLQAAREAADEIGVAVIATSLTLVAVFLPTAFMDGIPGKFFKQFGMVAAIAILSSLLVARMLTPMMSAYLLKAHPHTPKDGSVMKAYLASVRWGLRNVKKTLIATLVIVAGSFYIGSHISTAFIPPEQSDKITISVDLAPGASIDRTISATEELRAKLQKIDNIESVLTIVGGASSSGGPMGATSAGSVRSAKMYAKLKDKKNASDTSSKIREAMSSIPGVKFSIGAGGSGESLQISLVGDDPSTLKGAIAALEKDLRSIQGIGAISSSANLTTPELRVTPDMAKVASLGVAVSDIAATIRTATSGDFSIQLPKLNLPERQIPIRVILDKTSISDINALKQLQVKSAEGTVSIGDIADITLSSGPSLLTRYQRHQNADIKIDLNGQPMGLIQDKVKALPSYVNLPQGVEVLDSGEAKRMKELFSSFGGAMLTGIACVYIILVLLFHSFKHPITILTALPLSVGGALCGLVVFGYPFSMPALIGLLMLMGIVSKNSVLLVDYVILSKDSGNSTDEAILDACHKRARPIVMTSIAMIAGMIPMLLGGGDLSFRSPMAAVVIGGLITSTILSLLIVPVVFKFMDSGGLITLLKSFVLKSRAVILLKAKNGGL